MKNLWRYFIGLIFSGAIVTSCANDESPSTLSIEKLCTISHINGPTACATSYGYGYDAKTCTKLKFACSKNANCKPYYVTPIHQICHKWAVGLGDKDVCVEPEDGCDLPETNE